MLLYVYDYIYISFGEDVIDDIDISDRPIWTSEGDISRVSEASTCARDILPERVNTVYPKKYAHSFVVLCFVVVMRSFIMNSHEVFIHIHQGCFAGTGAIVRLPQCQWSKPDGYGKISQCITTTKHSKAKTVCIFLGIYCIYDNVTHNVFTTYTPNKHSTSQAVWIIIGMFWMYTIHSNLFMSDES